MTGITWRPVAEFDDRGSAEVCATALRSAEIPMRVVSEVSGAGGVAVALRRASIEVPEGQVEEARALLRAVSCSRATPRGRLRVERPDRGWVTAGLVVAAVVGTVLLVGLLLSALL